MLQMPIWGKAKCCPGLTVLRKFDDAFGMTMPSVQIRETFQVGVASKLTRRPQCSLAGSSRRQGSGPRAYHWS